MKKMILTLLVAILGVFSLAGCTSISTESPEEAPSHTHSLKVYANNDEYFGKVVTYCTDCKKVLDYDVLNYDSYQEADKVKEYKIALVEGKLYVKGDGNYIQVFIKNL